jgi:hypothetical protein
MSDYDPRPPGLKREPLRAPEVDPVVRNSGAGAFYLVGGVTVALVLVAGLLFFNPGSGSRERTDQARMPERRMEQPVTPAPPTAAPSMSTRPAPTPPDSVTPTNPQR